MTRRRYQHDSYQRECRAIVTGVREIGTRPALSLDETIFYPASGGQPSDYGTLAGAAVIDVIDDGGELWHVLDLAATADVPAVGARVDGSLDWVRRFDHMQQHTGQHILSQAFLRATGAATVSVHMERTCTLDLDARSLDGGGVERAEDLANTVVLENRPVIAREVGDDEAAAMGLRRPPKQTGVLRVVEVLEFDRSACGGTHVRTAGEVGPIGVRGWERAKRGVRVQFSCGWRAIRNGRQTRDAMRAVTGLLTTGEDDAAAAVLRVQTRVRDLERELAATRAALFEHEAERLLAAAPTCGGVRIITTALDRRPVEDMRALAQAVTAQPGAVVLVTIDPGRRLLVARSAGVHLDAAAVLREALAPFGGRGGGKPEAAEGAASAAPSAAALLEGARAAAERVLRERGTP